MVPRAIASGPKLFLVFLNLTSVRYSDLGERGMKFTHNVCLSSLETLGSMMQTTSFLPEMLRWCQAEKVIETVEVDIVVVFVLCCAANFGAVNRKQIVLEIIHLDVFRDLSISFV